jgi:hypothetical protein
MPVNSEMLKNALLMSTEDLDDFDDITKSDLEAVRKRFNQLLDTLKDECSEDLDEDD